MTNTVLILLVIAAILLIIVILIQNPKGGGLSSEFGGSAGSKMFGVQKTGDIVEKLTWGFFTFLVVGSLVTLVLIKTGMQSDALQKSDVNVEQSAAGTNIPALPSTPAQSLPAAPVETTPAQ